MNTVIHPKVKLFSGVLYSSPVKRDEAFTVLEHCFGEIDFRSQDFDFTCSDYYVSEMGSPIKRCFISFTELIFPERLAEIKLTCNEIENHTALQGKRKVNLDPGYIDYDKVVLASLKYNGQKIYLSNGIWADLTLWYEKGTFKPYPWSFPDYRTGTYNQVLLSIRARYKKQAAASNR